MKDMADYMKKRRAQRKSILIHHLRDICSVCGSNTNLEIDHIDPSLKLFTLSGSALDKPWKILLDEPDNCQLLCTTCHRTKTKQNSEYGGGHNKNMSEYVCGSPRTYSELKCRCPLCKQAKKLYRGKSLKYTDVLC